MLVAYLDKTSGTIKAHKDSILFLEFRVSQEQVFHLLAIS